MKIQTDIAIPILGITLFIITAITCIYVGITPYANFKCGNFGFVVDSEFGGSPLFYDQWSKAECYDGRVIICESACKLKSKLGNCIKNEMVCTEVEQ